MRRRRIGIAVAASSVSLALAACGSGASQPAAEKPEREPEAVTPVADHAGIDDFDRRNFPAAPRVDNRWMPLVPGTQFVLTGRSDRGQGRVEHRVVFTVTDLTKVIDGVNTIVMWDRDINRGRLLEGELAFHAQDNDGNVWNVGEYPEEYEPDGSFAGAPDTWLSGREGARAGVLMRADPRLGTSSYLQGRAPEIEFADRAKVHQQGLRTCVPLACYDDVLVTDEWNPLEPADGHQRKYYAAGVGNVRVGAVGGKEREGLVLVEVRRLDAAALAEVRREALKLDRRAYRAARGVYGDTRPAEPAGA
jgi:hypothetical protein